MPAPSGFKRCTGCRIFISAADWHELCLHSLGQDHPVSHCQKLTPRSKRVRDLQRRILFMDNTVADVQPHLTAPPPPPVLSGQRYSPDNHDSESSMEEATQDSLIPPNTSCSTMDMHSPSTSPIRGDDFRRFQELFRRVADTLDIQLRDVTQNKHKLLSILSLP